MPKRGQRDKQNTTQIIEKKIEQETGVNSLIQIYRRHSYLCTVNFIHIYAKEIYTFKTENYSLLFPHCSIYGCKLPKY